MGQTTKRWGIFERVYSDHWFLTSYNARGFIYDFPRLGAGGFLKNFIGVRDGDVCKYILEASEFEQAADFISERLLNDAQWRKWLYKKIDFYTRRYFAAGERLRQLPLSGLSDRQLASEIKKITPWQHWHQVYSIIANGMVTDGRNHLSNKIRHELNAAMGFPSGFDKYWSTLTLVTKMSLRQRRDYEMARLSKNLRRFTRQETERSLRSIYERYCWIDYMYRGPVPTLEEYGAALAQAAKGRAGFNLPNQLATVRKEQDRLMEQFHLGRRARFLVRLAQHVIGQKGYRKDMQYHGFWCYEFFLQEVARRQRIDDWSVLTFLLPWEVPRFILQGILKVAALRERRRFSCLVVDRRRVTPKVGAAARSAVRRLGLREDLSYLKESRGQCAYVGQARGRVKIVQTPADMVKMRSGDVLVSQATSPDLLPAMHKAAAIVTNTGGLICHAAITSRELKIPCIVGTVNATLIFRDGDFVEVDATQGIIRKL